MTTKKLSQTVSPITFFGSAIIALALIAYASLKPESAAEFFKHANDWVIAEAGWFYLLAVGFFVIFLLGLAISPYGRIKLGPDDSSPDYKYGTWVAMLFSAGMGIGIVFYGVAEPITHFSQPPDAEPRSVQAMRDAMEITYFHWGVHAWAIYALLGMCLAYFGYRKNQPLSLRSALYPLIGDRVNGPIGSAVDIFAVVGTLAGLATSLGLGVSQLNASLNYLFGLSQSLDMQLWLILIVTILATITVATGLDYGVRRLSEFIIILSFVLLFLLLCLGPSAFLMSAFVENLGLYLSGFVGRTFHAYAYDPTPWVGKWTLFYWGWWVSWAPFVGLFVARISRGRTIRQFLLGVLFAPAGFCFIWFTVFGDLAIWLDINRAGGDISATVAKDMSIALFTVFEYLPWSQMLAWMTGILVAVYFITASDAGALVIAMITARNATEDDEPALWLRVFWALTCGAVAACLLLAGGLDAVQSAALIAGLPLSVILLFTCWGIWKALSDEASLMATQSLQAAPLLPSDGQVPWRRRLSAIVSHPTKDQVNRFIEGTVKPALTSVKEELARRELQAEIEELEDGVQLKVLHGDGIAEFLYAVRRQSHPIPAFALSDQRGSKDERRRYSRAEVYLSSGGRGYDIYGYNAEHVISDVITHYDRFRHYLHTK